MLNVKAEVELDSVVRGQAPEAGDTREGLLRELDARVAERVMGWKHVRTPEISIPHFLSPEVLTTDYMKRQRFIEVESGNEENAPRYSTDIAAALEVVDRLRQRGWTLEMYAHPEGFSAKGYTFLEGTNAINRFTGEFICASLSEAICGAALAVIEQEKEG